MTSKLLLVFVLLFMVLPVSADTVDLEIWENSEGVFFITVDNGELQECNGTICTVDIERNSSTTISLSDGDIQYIAEYTSKQLIVDGFKSSAIDSDNLNETETRAIFWDVVAEWGYDNRAFTMKTWMPAVDEYNNMSLELLQAQGALDTLNAQFQGHAAVLEGNEITIELLRSEIELRDAFIIVLVFFGAILLLERSEFIRSIREWREK